MTSQELRDLKQNVPDQLRALPQWVLFKLEAGKDGKITKVPYQVRAFRAHARANDASTWASFDEAVMVLEQHLGEFDGVEFCVTKANGFTGIDYDKCRDELTGEIAAWAQDIVQQFASYTEVTVSYTGLRTWVLGSLNGHKNKYALNQNGNHPQAKVEVYDNDRFFVVTGNRLADHPATIEARQDELNAVVEELTRVTGKKASSTEHAASGTPSDEITAEILEAELSANEAKQVKDIVRDLASKNCPEYVKQLFEGEWEVGYQDQSSADWAFLCYVHDHFPNAMARVLYEVWRRSGLLRQKMERDARLPERTAAAGDIRRRHRAEQLVDRRGVPEIYDVAGAACVGARPGGGVWIRRPGALPVA